MAPSKSASDSDDKQNGSIFSISGPVIVAENMIGCAMYELVRQLHDDQHFMRSVLLRAL
jgi:V-type H+-transporting ATPase subunit A